MANENYCFCDLAPLYALDLLSPEERVWLEQQVARHPDLAAELAAYEAAATALPYAVPLQPMAADLKGRLFDRLGLIPPDSQPAPAPQPFLAVRNQDLTWQPHFIPGFQVALVHTDHSRGEWVGFLKGEPGACYPHHRHAGTEELFMLEGDLVIGEEVFGPGDYIRSPAGTVHAPSTCHGCRFFFRASMQDEYLHLDFAHPQ